MTTVPAGEISSRIRSSSQLWVRLTRTLRSPIVPVTPDTGRLTRTPASLPSGIGAGTFDDVRWTVAPVIALPTRTGKVLTDWPPLKVASCWKVTSEPHDWLLGIVTAYGVLLVAV